MGLPVNRLAIRSVITWVGFVPIAVANGVARDRLYGQHTSELAAHQISTVSGSLAFVAFAYGTLRGSAGRSSVGSAVGIGAAWVSATVVFEFALGRLRHLSWREMLAAYDLPEGRVWLLFLLVVLLTPSAVRWFDQR
jgi:hypothetical protein